MISDNTFCNENYEKKKMFMGGNSLGAEFWPIGTKPGKKKTIYVGKYGGGEGA